MFTPTRISQRIAAFLVAVTGLCGFATPASAQFGEAAGISDAMVQDYYSRDIRLFAEQLSLDDAQRSVIESLYMDYEQEFNDGLARMRKRLEDMREQFQAGDVDQVLRLVFKPIEEWSVEKRAMGDVFMENVKIVLTPEQQEMWPKFQRFLYREKNLSKGRLSGESLNLFLVVNDMALNPLEMQGVQPTLDEYDITLDAALRARQNAMISSQSDMFRSFAEQNASISLGILERQVQLAVAVRDVNDKYIESLAQVMPSEKSATFRQKALERAYPRVYRATPVQAIFTAAKELPGLDATTLEAIVNLEAGFLSELVATNGQLASTMRDWEPKENRLRAEAFARRMTNAQPEPIEDPLRAAFQARDEMQRRYVRLLQALLTPEQFGQVPGGYRWADTPGEERPATDNGAGGTKSRRAPAGTGAAEPTGTGDPAADNPKVIEENGEGPLAPKAG
jgi:Spy/CpxP family protein refolding chaperone